MAAAMNAPHSPLADDDTLLIVDNVGKKFCRSLKRSLWYGLRDLSAELVGATTDHASLRSAEFWANESISFRLRRGETLGLVGHNGAGKTTLLKMLNGLIAPDVGRIEVRGRMQALIALGAGFNPVLSGRENVYVNAAVLGVSRRQTDELFEEIVDFAGIGEFIDAPVQSYSSGMVVRLGFAVAAHMDPDILLVDEILAVGDVGFKRKCFAKIREFRSRGVGIVVVTHDMSQVYNLCDSALMLTRGRVVCRGEVDDVVRHYWEHHRSANAEPASARIHTESGSEGARLLEVQLLDDRGEPADPRTGEPLTVRVLVESTRKITRPVIGVGISVPGSGGSYVAAVNTKLSGFKTEDLMGRACFECRFDALPVYPGRYELAVTLNDEYGLRFDSAEGDTAIPLVVGHGRMGAGEVYVGHRWNAHPLAEDSTGLQANAATADSA